MPASGYLRSQQYVTRYQCKPSCKTTDSISVLAVVKKKVFSVK